MLPVLSTRSKPFRVTVDWVWTGLRAISSASATTDDDARANISFPPAAEITSVEPDTATTMRTGILLYCSYSSSINSRSVNGSLEPPCGAHNNSLPSAHDIASCGPRDTDPFAQHKIAIDVPN